MIQVLDVDLVQEFVRTENEIEMDQDMPFSIDQLIDPGLVAIIQVFRQGNILGMEQYINQGFQTGVIGDVKVLKFKAVVLNLFQYPRYIL